MTSVTLIMPLYNEAADVADVLASLGRQTYPRAAMYVVIVDGGSTDGSREAAQRWLAESGVRGVVIDNPRRTIPTSLNLGFAHARRGDIVIRLDAHTTYASDYVEAIVTAFASEAATVGCIGGPQIPRRETRFDLAVVTALYTNPLGLGGAGFRRVSQPVRTRGVYLGAWRPGVVEAAGGFDERWVANEDSELAARIRKLGYETVLIPVRSEYRVKRGPWAAIRQWGRYGYWRAQTLLRHPGEFRIRHLVPPLALVACALLAFTPLRALVGALYAIYFAGLCWKRDPGEPPGVTLATALFFPACQVAWGSGLLCGFAHPSASTRAARRTDVQPMHVLGKVDA